MSRIGRLNPGSPGYEMVISPSLVWTDAIPVEKGMPKSSAQYSRTLIMWMPSRMPTKLPIPANGSTATYPVAHPPTWIGRSLVAVSGSKKKARSHAAGDRDNQPPPARRDIPLEDHERDDHEHAG